MSDSEEDGLKRLKVDDIPLHAFTRMSLHDCIDRIIANGEKRIIANINIHALALARKDDSMRGFLQAADFVFCDGHGVMLLGRMAGQSVPEKITYAHWFPAFATHCAARSHSLYLLGGKPGVAEDAAERLKTVNPELRIVGASHGYFERSDGHEENANVLEQIAEADPDVLVVCMGMPEQEMWISRNQEALRYRVVLTGGAALDYASGRLKRPPEWLCNIGLEWLGRFLKDPLRLWYRYFVEMPLYCLGYCVRRPWR